MEPLRPTSGDFVGTTHAFDECDQPCRRFVLLLDYRPSQIGHSRGPWGRDHTKLPTELGNHRSPAMKHRAWRRITRGTLRSVSVQPHEVERPRAEPERPALDRPCNDAEPLPNARQRGSIGERERDGFQNDLDAGHLAGKRITREDSLTVPTTLATRECHRKGRIRVACLDPSLDPAPSKAEVAASTRSTTAAREQLVVAIIDDRGVLAKVDVEYENQVLLTVLGSENFPGPSSFWRTSRHGARRRIPRRERRVHWVNRTMGRESQRA